MTVAWSFSRPILVVSCVLCLALQSIAFAQKLGPLERRLHSAAERGEEALVQKAIDAGARINATDDKGRTALWKAVEKERGGVSRLLARLGADPEINDVKGRSARDLTRGRRWLLAEIDLGIAERSGTIAALRGFLAAHPSPIDIHGVRARVEAMEREAADWMKAVRADDAAGYQAFLTRHPTSAHAPAAVARLTQMQEEAARWSALEDAPSISGYDGFIRDFPGSTHLARARERREVLAADAAVVRARSQDTLQAWEDFVRAHPASTHRQEAGRRIEELAPDSVRERVRADMATVRAGATKEARARTLLFIVPELVGADQPDALMFKAADYSYVALTTGGTPADTRAVDAPLLRYMRPAEVAVLRVSERTLLLDGRGVDDAFRDLFVQLAKASKLELSAVRFITLNALAASSARRDIASKALPDMRRYVLALLVSDQRLTEWLPRFAAADRTWMVGVVRAGNWTPASALDTVNWESALDRWDRVRALGQSAVEPLQQAVLVGKADIRAAALEALDAIDPSRESSAWAESLRLNTAKAFDAYVRGHPSGRHAPEAQAILTRMRADNRPIEAAYKVGTEEALKQVLEHYPGHTRYDEVVGVLGDLATPRDVVDLLDDRKIEIEVLGSDIQSVRVRLRRMVNHPVNVRIPVGSYFVAASSAQNMVATSQRDLKLVSDDWQTFSLDAACANRPRRIPNPSDSFSVQRPTHAEELSRVAAALSRAGVAFAVRQAAVWIITDDASYKDLGSLVTRPAGRPSGSRTISEAATVRAMQLIESAGIDITGKRIWKDQAELLSGVADPVLKTWLERRIAAPRP